jgi:hypothetical protein
MARRGRIIPFPGVGPASRPGDGPGRAPAAPVEPPAEWAEVRRCDQAEALIVRGLLETAGIPVLLRSRLLHSVHPFSVGDQGEVVVLVPAAHAVRARRLLLGPVRRRVP